MKKVSIAVGAAHGNTLQRSADATARSCGRQRAPSPKSRRIGAIEVYNANGGLLDLNGMQVTLTGSEFYNGVTFLGAIQLEAQDLAGTWYYITQWSTYIGSSKGIYVLFNGRNMQSPLVRGVRAIRLSGVNGATAFRIGMLNLTAR